MRDCAYRGRFVSVQRTASAWSRRRRRFSAARFERRPAEPIVVKALSDILALAGLGPLDWREFEDAVTGPLGQQAEDVSQVRPRLDLAQAAAREERHEARVDLATLVASYKQPVFTADGLTAQGELALVVVDRKTPILDEARQADTLVAGVADAV